MIGAKLIAVVEFNLICLENTTVLFSITDICPRHQFFEFLNAFLTCRKTNRFILRNPLLQSFNHVIHQRNYALARAFDLFSLLFKTGHLLLLIGHQRL
ncbi:Uncharacterised protein [Vibrio cholerae]|uniref:Uncharacterized protein n=1 Tax=Vibrio cholerae TaxID=666 RepID=A0A655XYW0_VIBCL|nr:Uncharacterised protein [Vibrio cholerae]